MNMKTKMNFLSFLVFTGIISWTFFSCSKDAAVLTDDRAPVSGFVVERGSGPSASGQGSLLLNDRVQHFAFHAAIDAAGNVSGSWESNSPGQDIRTHGTINCLVILADGKTALMSGEITHVDGEGFPGISVGDPVWFQVQDNGEGKKATPDRFTDYYLGLSGCFEYGVGMLPILNGNIQVRP